MFLRILLVACSISAVSCAIYPASGADPPLPPSQPYPAVSVLVLPFAPLGPDTTHAWVSQAVQQNFLAELGGRSGVRLIAPAGQQGNAPAVDLPGALQAGRDAQAGLVVFGNYQVIEPDVRLIGQVADVQSGQVAGSLKATGKMTQLFDMEDALASQLVNIVAPGQAAAATTDEVYTSAGQTYQPPVASAYTPPASYNTYNYYPDTYAYPYDYSYPGYSYPAYCWPGPFFGFDLGSVFLFDTFGHRHDHDRFVEFGHDRHFDHDGDGNGAGRFGNADFRSGGLIADPGVRGSFSTSGGSGRSRFESSGSIRSSGGGAVITHGSGGSTRAPFERSAPRVSSTPSFHSSVAAPARSGRSSFSGSGGTFHSSVSSGSSRSGSFGGSSGGSFHSSGGGHFGGRGR